MKKNIIASKKKQYWPETFLLSHFVCVEQQRPIGFEANHHGRVKEEGE